MTLSRVFTFLALGIALASPVLRDTQALPIVCHPCARAAFSVNNFSQEELTWSLKVVVDGDAKNTTFLSERVQNTIFLNLYSYNSIYDSNTNTTTFSDSHHSFFTSVEGSFPAEVWYFQFYLSINASVQNFVHSPAYPYLDTQIPDLPTPNYVGNYSISIVHPTASNPSPFADVSQIQRGPVYNFTSYVWRSDVNGQVLNTIFVGTLYILVAALYAVPILQLYLRIPHRKYFRMVERNLLNSTYFTVVVGFLFFLPIYQVSLRPSLAPIPYTSLDSEILVLALFTAILVTFSFVVYLALQLRPRNQQYAEKSAAHEDLHETGAPAKRWGQPSDGF